MTTIRPFTADDIPFGMSLKDLAGWNQLPADWERLLTWEPEGCFVAEHDGVLAGTATTFDYEGRFGWVGMVLVHPEMRRKGIGTALLMHGIEYLEAKGVAAVKLDATPMGKQLYDQIGFVDEYMIERRGGVASPPAPLDDLRSFAGEGRTASLSPFDAPLFGADRGRVLRSLAAAEGAHAGAEHGEDGGVRGYVMVRRGRSRNYVGPWVADDPEVAARLFDWAMAQIAGEPFFVDVCLACPHVNDIVTQVQYPTQRQLIRMYRGTNAYPGEPAQVYGLAGPEIG